jgi:hypothetical protein
MVGSTSITEHMNIKYSVPLFAEGKLANLRLFMNPYEKERLPLLKAKKKQKH